MTDYINPNHAAKLVKEMIQNTDSDVTLIAVKDGQK